MTTTTAPIATTPRHTYNLPATPPRDLPPHLCGLMVDSLRSATDCTNGGVSASHNRLVVVGVLDSTNPTGKAMKVEPMPPAARVFAATPENPPVALEVRGAMMGTNKLVTIVPVTFDAEAGHYVRAHSHTMAGGNYAALGDSRMGELVEGLLGVNFYGALAIHDRAEW